MKKQITPASARDPFPRADCSIFACRKIAVTAFLAVISLVVGSQTSWSQAEERRGLPSFGRVAENLYRGGQPTPDGFNALRAMGVGIVVNFRDDPVKTAAEKQEVESLGIKYVAIPWNANHKPSSAQVLQFLDLVRANPDTKIFVHCRRGADRTGTMIASYRIAVEHQSVPDALSEMHRYHYDWLFRSQLKHYVESFPELLENDPEFSAYRPNPVDSR